MTDAGRDRSDREHRGAGAQGAQVAAALWSLGLAAAGTVWTVTGGGWPFGAADPGAAYSALGPVAPPIGAPIAALAGGAGIVVAVSMLRDVRSGGARRGPTVAAVVFAALLLLVVVDYRVLVVVAYTPLVLVGLPFGWISIDDYVAAFSPPIVAQLYAMVGVLAWGWAAVAHARAAPTGWSRASWAEPERAARWGLWATGVAVAIPLVYAATRWSWALGIPLGITDELLHYGQETGLWIAGAGLATLAAVGGIVTTGLSMRWGETWPSWVPRLGGRPVPVAAAVVPALIVASLVTSAGLMFVRLAITGTFEEALGAIGPIEGSWAALVPELLWPAWGVALALAALGYGLRRGGAA